MRILRNILIGLVLVIVGVVMLMLLPSPQPESAKPWEVAVMPDGNVEILSIHLGKTDFETAQKQLNTYGKIALFNEPDGTNSVEAFFDNTNLGGLTAKLVLNIGVSQQQLAQMLERAGAGRLQPSGAHQHELANVDRQTLLTMPVMAMTYIPTVRLSEEMLLSRFGDPDTKTPTVSNEEGQSGEVWHYDALNLIVVIEPAQKPILIFRAKSTRNAAVTE